MTRTPRSRAGRRSCAMFVLVRIAVALAAIALVALPSVVGADDQPRTGGVLKVAMIGEPPTLDPHTATAGITQQIMWPVFETLYTYDKQYNPIPLLAESHAVGDNGRTYTFKLRRGVKFHSGRDMNAEDVALSLKRWGKLATPGKAIFKNVEDVQAKDPQTVVMYLKEPSAVLLMALARPNNGAFIYPKEVMAASGDTAIKDNIGTGPYRFVEHRPDRHIRLTRFKEYSARTEPANFFGGKRVAHLDEIRFIPVPDVAVRLAGAESGEYHFSQQIKQDQYERLKTIKSLVPSIIKPSAWTTAVLNHKQGVMTDKRIRQAMQAVLDMEPIMAAGFGDKAFYRLDPGLMHIETPQWHSKAGGELYNQKNPERAK